MTFKMHLVIRIELIRIKTSTPKSSIIIALLSFVFFIFLFIVKCPTLCGPHFCVALSKLLNYFAWMVQILQAMARMMNAMGSMLCSIVDDPELLLEDGCYYHLPHCHFFHNLFLPYIAACSDHKARVFITNLETNLYYSFIKYKNMMTTQTILLIQSPCNERSKQQFQMAQSTILHEICIHEVMCGGRYSNVKTVSWFDHGNIIQILIPMRPHN